MSNTWDLNNPLHAEAALTYLYSLPDDDADSDTECDEGSKDELAALDNLSIRTFEVEENAQENEAAEEVLPPSLPIPEEVDKHWRMGK